MAGDHQGRGELLLASGSPRRRLLLAEAGVRFGVLPPTGLDEDALARLLLAARRRRAAAGGVAAARWLSASLALLKALAAAAQWAATAGRPSWILAADTVVCAPDGALLGQPADRAGAAAMLVRLAGRPHRVVSAAVLLQAQQGRQRRWIETSTVAVRALGPAELRRYLDSGAWRGKAGGYGVQDEPPIAQVQAGSRSNAMGLPLERLLPVLRELGFVDPLPSGAGAAGSGAPVSA